MDTYTNDGRLMLETWFRKATPWQKDLFVQIWNEGQTADEILKRAIKLIGQEHLSENHRVAAVTEFPNDITIRNQGNKQVILAQISDITGIGALDPRKPLTFGDGLTVVYGQNGCGKSSYVRILKALANPTNGTAVFGNVYQENPGEPMATAVFTEDGVERKVLWTKTCKEKQPIQIYDTIEADRFVNKENEVIYEPKVLSVITQMATIYDRLSDHFSQQVTDTERQILKLPHELAFHPIAAEFSALTSQDGLNAFVKKYPWTDAEVEELGRIEAALKESTPEQTAKSKIAQRELIRSHGFNILKMLQFVSDEARIDYLEKRDRQIETKKAADVLVANNIKQSLLQKFGGDPWKMMWLRATEYVCDAEGNADMPVTESGRCALCQQELDIEAFERMKRFQEFVRSSAIEEAEKAYQDFETTVRLLQENVENKINLTELKTVMESSAIFADIQDDIIALYEAILSRCKWLLNYSDETDTEIPYVQSRDEIVAAIRSIVDNLNAEIKVLQAAAENRDKLLPRMHELVVVRWTYGNLAQKQRLIVLKTVCAKCKTNALTSLKKDLSKQLITNAYIDRFQEEMNLLDKRKQIKVELVAQAPKKGKSYHQVVLKDACSVGKHKNNEVLSEGESRVVSLAAFLSDLSSWHRNMPFVFDDPITSLDHLYENNVAARLVRLSTERQVIVFTHRLAFAQLLESAVTAFNADAIRMGKAVLASITHIELRQSPLGHPDSPNYVNNLKLESAVKNLLNHDLQAIKRHRANDEFDEAEARTLKLCASFRNMIEYGVEQNLLSGVVSRFARNVSTLKLPCLNAITQNDIMLFDDMMTKYSYYDHSHSIETPLPPPDIEEIEKDLMQMRDWAKDFEKRCKAAQDKAKGKK